MNDSGASKVTETDNMTEVEKKRWIMRAIMNSMEICQEDYIEANKRQAKTKRYNANKKARGIMDGATTVCPSEINDMVHELDSEFELNVNDITQSLQEQVTLNDLQATNTKKTSINSSLVKNEEEVKQNHTIINGKAVQNNSHNNTETFNNSTQIFAQPEAKRKLSNWGEKRPVSRSTSLASNEKRKELERSKREGFVHSKSRINIGGITFDETRTGKGRSTSREFSIGNKVVEGRHPELKRIASQLRQSISSSRFTHEDQLKKRDKSLNKKLGGMSFGK